MKEDLLDQIDFKPYLRAVDGAKTVVPQGRVSQVIGLIAEGDSLGLGVGGICSIINDQGLAVMAEVVGFKENRVLLMPYGDTRGLRPGSRITLLESSPRADVGDAFLGRVVDGMGRPIDGLGKIQAAAQYPLYGKPINPLERRSIKDPMDVGIAAINTMIPLGQASMTATDAPPSSRRLILVCSAKTCCRTTKINAPTMGPSMVPIPPMMTMKHSRTVHSMPNALWGWMKT